MQKAPDTRNRLDNNKGLNKKNKPKLKKKGSLKELQVSNSKLKFEKKITKGELFKQKFGYSKTMKRNMNIHGLNPNEFSDSLNEYRAIRKKRKKDETKVRQEKHKTSVLYKRTNKKTKGSSGSKPANKTKK